MSRKRYETLLKRLSTGELTAVERRELDELCAKNAAWRDEAEQIEAIVSAAHASRVEPPSDFEWAAFMTRLTATIEAERPRPYSHPRLWLEWLAAVVPSRRLAVVTTAAVVLIAGLIGLLALRSTAPVGTQVAEPLPEPVWDFEELDAYYVTSKTLVNEELVTLEDAFWKESDAVNDVIEQAPELDEQEIFDEESIFG